MLRGGIAIGGSLVALAIAASPALATTDRADYASQVNAICSSANTQVMPLLTSRAKNATGQILALLRSELAALSQVPPAPGDESLVSSWLGNRQLIQGLVERDIALDRRIQRRDESVFNGKHSVRAIKQFLKWESRAERKLDRMQRQIDQAAGLDVGLAGNLGAGQCVSFLTAQALLEG